MVVVIVIININIIIMLNYVQEGLEFREKSVFVHSINQRNAEGFSFIHLT